MNLVLIVVAVIFLVCAIGGLRAGFVRKASGLVSFLLAAVLVTALLPGVTSWLKDQTPVYGLIQKQCAAAAEGIAKQTLTADLSGSDPLLGENGSGAGDGSVNRSAVKGLVEQYGYDASAVDNMSDDQIKALINQYLGVSAGAINPLAAGPSAGALNPLAAVTPVLTATLPLPIWGSQGLAAALPPAGQETGTNGSQGGDAASETYGVSENLANLMDAMTASDKRKFIESLPIPDVLQDQIEAFNNKEGYLRLGAENFASYIVNYFANLILHVVAYFLTLLATWLIIRLILGAAGIFSRLPLVRTVDHLLGLVLGLVQGLFFVWALFLVLSFFAATPVGQVLMGQIYRNPFLEILYNLNIFLKSVSVAMKGIL